MQITTIFIFFFVIHNNTRMLISDDKIVVLSYKSINLKFTKYSSRLVSIVPEAHLATIGYCPSEQLFSSYRTSGNFFEAFL